MWPYLLVLIAAASTNAALPFTRFAQSNYLYLIGLSSALVSNVAWLSLARITPKLELARVGLIWDATLTICYLVVPIMLGARFNMQMGLGLTLIITGVLIVKGA
jgi:uncharacterized membrane protein